MRKFSCNSLIFSLLLILSCSVNEGKGILGIEVPIGEGKVSQGAPYIITGIVENGPAHIAGVKPGDQIVQINEMPIESGMRFDEIYNKYLVGKAGSRVTLYVKRGDQNLVFEITRGAVKE